MTWCHHNPQNLWKICLTATPPTEILRKKNWLCYIMIDMIHNMSSIKSLLHFGIHHWSQKRKWLRPHTNFLPPAHGACPLTPCKPWQRIPRTPTYSPTSVLRLRWSECRQTTPQKTTSQSRTAWNSKLDFASSSFATSAVFSAVAKAWRHATASW